MGYEMAVIFIVGAYLLRPTLHAFDLAQGFEDERQILNHSRAGNIAFIVVMLTVVGLALSRIAQGEQPDDYYLILTFGIAARALTGLLLHGDLRKTGSLMIIIIGLVFAVFGLASARFSVMSSNSRGTWFFLRTPGLLRRQECPQSSGAGIWVCEKCSPHRISISS